MRQRVSLVPLVAFLSLPPLASAATIRGTVTDASLAAVAGAQVTVKNVGTGVVRPASTNAAGAFSVADLAVGRYEVEVAFAGVKTAAVRRIVPERGAGGARELG